MDTKQLNLMKFYKKLSQNFNLIDFQCRMLAQSKVLNET
jgi:hypothetical protein